MYGNIPLKNMQLLLTYVFIFYVNHQNGGCMKSIFSFRFDSNKQRSIVLNIVSKSIIKNMTMVLIF
jgi:hypothetical protein